MDIANILTSVLSNVNLWGAICSTILIIALGFVLLKVKVFKVEWKAVLNSIVLKVALPALAFTGFMKSCTVKELQEQGIVLGVGFAFYIVLILVAEIWVRFFPKFLPKMVGRKNKQVFVNDYIVLTNSGIQTTARGTHTITDSETKRSLVMWMMLIFGSAIFFGFPIIKAINENGESSQGFIAANIWTIPYRIFIQSYCMMAICGTKFCKCNIKQWTKEAFVNPIIIPTFIGIILWLTQLIPGASDFGNNFSPGSHGWFNWKVTMPYLYKPIEILAATSSPLIWLSIGMTLATSDIKQAAKDKWIWIFSFEKLILMPLLVFLIMWGLMAGSAIDDPSIAVAMVVLAATPPATAVIAYTMKNKTCDEFAVQCSALTTLLSIVALPVWVIISQIVFQIYA